MSQTFQVAVHPHRTIKGERGMPYLVTVAEVGNPTITAHLRVLHFVEDGVDLLRIVWAGIASDDEDAAVHTALASGVWWDRALEAVLDQVIFNSPAVDHAVDEEEGVLRYGWVGGEVQESTLLPTGDTAASPMTKCDIGNPSMTWARQVFEPGADLTEEQLERFFDEIAQMLAAKAFEQKDGDGEGRTGGPGAPEGGSR